MFLEKQADGSFAAAATQPVGVSAFITSSIDLVTGSTDKAMTNSTARKGAATLGLAAFAAGSVLGRRRQASGQPAILKVFG